MILKFRKKKKGGGWRGCSYDQINLEKTRLKKKKRLLYIELSRAIHMLMVNGRP